MIDDLMDGQREKLTTLLNEAFTDDALQKMRKQFDDTIAQAYDAFEYRLKDEMAYYFASPRSEPSMEKQVSNFITNYF